MAVLSLNLMFAAATGFTGARAEDALPSEYQMKAAYLFNFTKFIDWPPEAMPDRSPLLIGVLGNDPFSGLLESTIQNKQINGHPLVVRHLKTVTEAKACQILFVGNSERRHWPEIQNVLSGSSVLTVSENWNRFTQDGGMIYFFMEGNKVCFDINDAAAKRAGLQISSKLLLLRKKPSE